MEMGIGIWATRVAGLNVTFIDPSEASLKRSQKVVKNWYDKQIAKERLKKEETEAIVNQNHY